MRYPKLHADKLKIVIFDWDNTLAETRTPLIYAVNRVLKEYGLPEWKEVKKLRDNNLSFRDNFPRIFGSRADEAYRKYAEIYLRSVAGLISTFAGTHEVLSWLKRRHVRLAIMTNKDRRLLEFELPLLFRPDIFDRVVCTTNPIPNTRCIPSGDLSNRRTFRRKRSGLSATARRTVSAPVQSMPCRFV